MAAPADIPPSALASVREICGALPEVVESDDRIRVVFKVRRRIVTHIMTVTDPAGAPVTLLMVRAPEDDLVALAATGHPFFRPRSAHADGWLGVIIDTETDWAEIEELVIESYLAVAPKKLIAQLDLPDEPE